MRAWATSSSTSFNRLAAAVSPLITGALLASPLGVAGVFLLNVALHGTCSGVIWFWGIETRWRTLEEISP